ncbi:polyphosphate--glucose phosphotransferase [Sediminicola luteus]|uniref:Polyphosphate glucokinase n=1 Tax=Sediminicola luteus TaxID=319238 RepID=A0A2A4G7K9_9FLAO|nr:ROK family protein [Sediminicola luteus]PCE64423.1 polyphosphate glucokinase [Sediminicola luteus]
MNILGIDIGGSGMKGALVDIITGERVSDRFRVPTPETRNPEGMAGAIKEIVDHFDYHGPVGCGFPTSLKKGVCNSAGNLDPSWVGQNVAEVFNAATGLPFTVVNDADAAAFAEIRYGAGLDVDGLVVMITIGTGLGSGVFWNGELIPNFELGQLPYKEYSKIELWAAGSAKDREGLSYKKWVKRFNKFLQYIDLIVSPDLIIVGGGASKDWAKFEAGITIPTPVVPAQLKNHAGIIGAAAMCPPGEWPVK